MRTKNINTSSHWDTKWGQEGKNTWRQYPNINKQELKWIEDNKRLADLGCGNGFFLNLVQQDKENMKLIGLDISSVGIKQLKEFYNINGVVSILPKIPLEPESFDYVIMNELIEHVVEEDELLKNAFKICKTGGWVFVSTPSDHSPKYKDFIKNQDSEHVRWYDKERLEKSLMLYGKKPEIIIIKEDFTRNGIHSRGEYYLARSQK